MFNIPLSLIYPIYTLFLGLIMFFVVPREKIKLLSLYAILYGAVFDICVMLIAKLFNIGGHINYSPLGQFGVSFFPPIAWTAFFILYLYILPLEKPWDYLFTLSSALYSTFFANILINLNVLETNIGRTIFPFMIYLTWHGIVTYTFLKYLKDKNIYILK